INRDPERGHSGIRLGEGFSAMASMAHAGMTRQQDEPKIITASKQMKDLFAYASRVAVSDAKVLITGESGVGKDIIARYIHAHSLRRTREYVPVLRDRREDIKPLAIHFLNRSGKDIALTDEAWSVLERHRWPGNVRELQNVMEQISSVATDDVAVDVAQLPHILKSTGQAVLP